MVVFLVLFVHPCPPFVCAARTQICVHVKHPISICRKRVGITAGGMETRKYCTEGEGMAGGGGGGGGGRDRNMLGSAVLWLLAFPEESSPNFQCIALEQESF